ncbi:MAG: alpha/beta fold hydrolase [Patescibacteria group bacterium]
MQKINFFSQGQRIDGTLFIPEQGGKKLPGVIFFHGLTSSENRYLEFAELLSQNGIVALTVNMRGHDTSEGDPDVLKIHDTVSDGMATYDFLVGQEQVDPNRVGICGSSLGGAIAAITSSSRNVKSLLLRAPAIYSDAMMAMTFNQIMAEEDTKFHKIQDPANTMAIRAISQFRGNLLVVTSELDAILPETLTSQYFAYASEASHKEKFVMQGVPHPLNGQKNRDDFAKIMLVWFMKTL